MTDIKKMNITQLVLLFAIVVCGGFNEYISCICSVILAVNIIIKSIKTKQIKVNINPTGIAVVLICLFYGITVFWAIDSGMAFIGFLKFLPIFLYFVSANQEQNFDIEEILPYFVGVVSVISIICMQIPVIGKYFTVAERFAGTFQYPNTFALVLLVCELMVLKSEKITVIKCITALILIASLLYTGSRSVFVLFIISNLAFLVIKLKTKRKAVLITLLITAVVLGITLFVFRENVIINRYLRISVFESTFVGRILYLVDALPLVIKYPFGMGYYGYSYIQNSIQTGVYTVKYVHNDFLQFFLDVGIIPATAFIVSVVYALTKKSICIFDKIIISVMVLHALFDFDFQYISVLFILLFYTNKDIGKTYSIKSISASCCVCVAVIIVNIYMALPLSFSYFKKYETAEELYSYNTENKIAILSSEENIDNAEKTANEILKQNKASYIPYSIKAKYEYQKGNFSNLIKYKNEVFERNPFEYSEYEEYCTMLIYGLGIYIKNDDMDSAKLCLKELESTKEKLYSNNTRLSKLGKMIKDQPQTELSEEVLAYIEKAEEVLK